jgi:DNA-binding NarL/FixJ family response regulator
MTKNKINIYLADDHEIVIDGLKLLIGNEPMFRVIGWTTDGKTACKEILEKKPDIALLDIRMPGMSGIELISALRKKVETKFVILSMHNEPHNVQNAISYGAYGYLVKNTGKEELMRCINKVIAGESYFPIQSSRNKDKDKKTAFTPRELEIIKLIINEYTSQQIAQELNLSHFTIETHRKNICKKTQTKSAVGLIKYVTENNIPI